MGINRTDDVGAQRIAVRRAAFMACCTVLALIVGALIAWGSPAAAFGGDLATATTADLEVADVSEGQSGGRAWDGTADVSWYDSGKTAFVLETPEQVAGLALISSGKAADIEQDTFAGKTVTLGADLVLNEAGSSRNWKPIADINRYDGTDSSSETFFDGTFDGAGHKVFGLVIDPGDLSAANNYGGYQAFFGSLGPHAVVRDLGVESGKVIGRVAAGIAAVSHVSDMRQTPQIVGCYNKADIAGNGSSSRGSGGIFAGEDQMGAGHSATVTDDYRAAVRIYDCYNQGSVISTGPAGGIAGTGSVQIRGCYNSGSIRTLVEGSTQTGAIVSNLFASGYTTAGDLSANGVVAHCYALDSSCPNLYRIYDAIHDANDPAFPSQLGSSTTKFLEQAELTVASALMGSSFEDDSLTDPKNGRFPLLYWQAGLPRLELANAHVVPIADQKYTSNPVKPAVEVRASEGGAKLVEGTDYLVRYEDNVDAGAARVVLTGVGRYAGEHEATFQIVQISLSDCVIEPLGGYWFYGEPVTPKLTVRTPSGSKLKEGEDYAVFYKDNDAAGRATATIKPVGAGTAGQQSTTFVLEAVSTTLAGAGTGDDPFVVSSKGDLQFVSRMVNTGAEKGRYANACYRLSADIDASPTAESPVSIDPIGLKLHPFAGTFDGAGHTITVGLSPNVLSDYIFEDPYENGWTNLALFCSTPRGNDDYGYELDDTVTIENLTIDGSVESRASASAFLGAVWESNVVLRNCTNKATVKRTNTFASNETAGFVAYASWYSRISFENCVNEGSVSGASAVAGFVGDAASSTISFKDCVNRGTIASSNMASGFIGEFQPNGSSYNRAHFTIENCANEGDVSTDYVYGAAGGFLGGINSSYSTLSDETCTIVASYNAGSITGSEGVGGIVGKVYHTPIEISGCYNVGTVTNRDAGELDRASGIMGDAAYQGPEPWLFSGVYNAGQLVNESADGASYDTAGILGCAFYGAVVNVRDAFYLDTAPAGIAVTSGSTWTSGPITGEAAHWSRDDLTRAGAGGAAEQLGSMYFDDDVAAPRNGGMPVLYWQAGKERRDLGATSISVEPVPAQCYSGYELRPPVVVVDSDRGYTLKEGSDYSLSYENNVVVDSVAVPTITITGRAFYYGQRTTTFAIEPMPISSCEIADIPAAWCAPGAAAKPSIRIARPSEYVTKPVLEEGRDYDIVVTGADAAGTATVTITGKGNYTGVEARQFDVHEASERLEGMGSKDNPYQLWTAADLELVAAKVNAGDVAYQHAYYRQGRDIDTADPLPSDSIGTAAHPFMGSFDGAGFALSRTVVCPGEGAAVFGHVENAVIRDVTVEGSIETTDYWKVCTSGLVSMATGSLLMEDCINKAHLAAQSTYVGGLVGRVQSAEGHVRLTRCANLASFGTLESASQNGNAYLGGLVGCLVASDATIADCHNAGSLAADEELGGLVGYVTSGAKQTKLHVKRSYNTGAMSTGILGGGLVGYVFGNSDLELSDCYSTGVVTGRGLIDCVDGVGGLVGGQAAGVMTMTRCYAAGPVTGSRDGSAVAGGLVGELESRVSPATISASFYRVDEGASIGSVGIDSAASIDDASQGVGSEQLKTDETLRVLGFAFGPDVRLVNFGFPILPSQKTSIAGCIAGVVAEQTYTGYPIEPAIGLFDPSGVVLREGRDYAVAYDGNVDAGAATITFVGVGAYTGMKTCTFEIMPAAIEDCAVAEIGDVPLGDDGAVPSLRLTNPSGKQLVEGVDFVVSYAGNKAIGTATATIVGKGNYAGVRAVTFEAVARVALGASDVAPIEDVRYTGEAVEPDPVVTVAGKELVRGVDYEARYENNVDAGTACVVVTGKGLYKGDVRVEFAIVKEDIAKATFDEIDEIVFAGVPAEPAVNARMGASKLERGRDYEVTYRDNAEPGQATAVVRGMGLYAGTAEITFEIREAALTAGDVSPIGDAVYTGSAIRPEVSVAFGARALERGVDYTVVYANNVDVGTAIVTVVGKGMYSGQAQVTFQIEPAPLAKVAVGQIPAQNYAGKPVVPAVVATFNGQALVPGVDFAVSCENNGRVGNAVAVLVGRGNFAGSMRVPFVVAGGAEVGSKIVAQMGKGKASFRVTAPGEVELASLTGFKGSAFTADVVSVDGVSYRVTAVKARAFVGTPITKVVLGKHVRKVAKRAFAGAKSLRSVVVKTKKLKKGSVKGCFAGSTVKSVKVKVGKKSANKKFVKRYRKTLGKKSVSGKKVTVK